MTTNQKRSRKKVVTPKELHPLKLWKKGKLVLTDDIRVIGWGPFESIPKPLLKEYYGEVCFNFDYLQDALNFFKSTHNSGLIRCYIPKGNKGPVFFVGESNAINRKKPQEVFFAIAPRVDAEMEKSS